MKAINNKAVCFTLWFPHHNNPRYADLFPRLDPLVRFHKVILSRHRILRAFQYRLWNALSRNVTYPGVLRYLSQRYDTLFTVDYNQILAWPRHESVVVDIDDPVFSPTEVKLLNLPQVKAIIVTTDKAKRIFEQLGVQRPIWIIPQGVSVGQLDPHKVQEIRQRFKTDGDVVVGYHAPTLTLSSDGEKRARDGQDDLDLLFSALEKAREVQPRMKLWLFGESSESVKKYAAEGRAAWIRLFGYVQLSEIQNYLSEVDIGVYPRIWSSPPARFSVKIAQFMACGVPVVSTNLDESSVLSEARCGLVCKSQEDFSQALVELAQSAKKRAELGNAGRTYAQTNLEWSVLVPIYRDILDEPRNGASWPVAGPTTVNNMIPANTAVFVPATGDRRQAMKVFVRPHQGPTGKFEGIVRAFPQIWEGFILDVGSRPGHLKLALLNKHARYCGLDLSPPADVVADLDAGLPFGDASYDTVVALDVLEHTDDIYKTFGELCRVARRYVLIILPNVFELKHRLRFVLGRLPSGKYGLPFEPPNDRHRWLFSFTEAQLFSHRRATLHGFELVAEGCFVNRRGRFGVGRLLISVFPNLLSQSYIALLRRREAD